MSANAQWNGSSLWQQYDIVCYGLSPLPFLSLLFIFFQTVVATLHLRGNWARSCPGGFADGASKIPIWWCSPRGFHFPEHNLVLLKYEHHYMQGTHWAHGMYSVWISLLFPWSITSCCISFILLEPINTTHNSLRQVVKIVRLYWTFFLLYLW